MHWVLWLCWAVCSPLWLLDWHINPLYTFTFRIAELQFSAWPWVIVTQNLQEVDYMQKFYEYQGENMADFHKSLLLRVESLFAMKVIYRAVFHLRKKWKLIAFVNTSGKKQVWQTLHQIIYCCNYFRLLDKMLGSLAELDSMSYSSCVLPGPFSASLSAALSPTFLLHSLQVMPGFWQ